MAPLFYCTVPGVPVPQSRARTTKNGTFYSARSTAHRHELAWRFKEAYAPRQTGSAVSILIEVAGMRADSDLDNHAKMVLDALVDACVLARDDVTVVRELVVRVVSGEPRTAVTVTAHG